MLYLRGFNCRPLGFVVQVALFIYVLDQDWLTTWTGSRFGNTQNGTGPPVPPSGRLSTAAETRGGPRRPFVCSVPA